MTANRAWVPPTSPTRTELFPAIRSLAVAALQPVFLPRHGFAHGISSHPSHTQSRVFAFRAQIDLCARCSRTARMRARFFEDRRHGVDDPRDTAEYELFSASTSGHGQSLSLRQQWNAARRIGNRGNHLVVSEVPRIRVIARCEAQTQHRHKCRLLLRKFMTRADCLDETLACARGDFDVAGSSGARRGARGGCGHR